MADFAYPHWSALGTGPPSGIDPLEPADNQSPGAGDPAVCYLPACPGLHWHLAGIRFSYNGVPAGGILTVSWTDAGQPGESSSDSGTSRQEVYHVSDAGPGSLRFDPPLRFPEGQPVTITLLGVGSVLGSVYATAWVE